MRLILIVFVFQLVTLGMYGQNRLVGYYNGNFAIGGLYLTQMEIRPDSSFLYQMVGDTYNDKAYGRVRLQNKRYLMLNFLGNDSLTSLNYDPMSRPKGFYIDDNDLFEISQDNEIKIKNYKLSRFRRYIFFGHRRIMKRKYFLRKRENGDWIDW